jgi:large subunit ribosomal protein L7A
VAVERLKAAPRKTVGTKQTTKAVERGEASTVYVAKDADAHVTRQLVALCRQRGVEVVEVESMALLGKACGLEVGAASAAVLTG